ncbi:hypothetical protein CL630_01650 [bacterium]|nr:hypothetical protein [bacterium]|tara:strand:+ start:321 stop:551 length:231 start_codon:yes stop_codon:yes gene_type:complete
MKEKMKEKEYVLYVYRRKDGVFHSSGKHSQGKFKNDKKAQKAFLQEARDFKKDNGFDFVQIAIYQGIYLVCRKTLP